MSYGEGIAAGVLGVIGVIALLMIGGMLGENSVARRMKSCMEISTSDQCMNQFIGEYTRKPGN